MAGYPQPRYVVAQQQPRSVQGYPPIPHPHPRTGEPVVCAPAWSHMPHFPSFLPLLHRRAFTPMSNTPLLPPPQIGLACVCPWAHGRAPAAFPPRQVMRRTTTTSAAARAVPGRCRCMSPTHSRSILTRRPPSTHPHFRPMTGVVDSHLLPLVIPDPSAYASPDPLPHASI